MLRSKRNLVLVVAVGLMLVGFAMAILPGSKSQAQNIGGPAKVLTTPPANDVPVRKITAGQAAVLGVVEGLTEYLPVSSTGHLILTAGAMGLSKQTSLNEKINNEAIDAFEIVIQFGAILAVLGLYRTRVGQMFRGLAGRDPAGLKLVGLLLLAFLPAAVVGLLAHTQIKAHLFAPVPVCLALAVGGVAMILVERRYYRRSKVLVTPEPLPPNGTAGLEFGPVTAPRLSAIDQMSYRQALFIGIFQCIAMWPGTSRSMITIVAALLVGLDMLAAAEFSFLLALPTLGAATLYEGFKSRHELLQVVGPLEMVIGLVVSGLVAAIAVKAFVKWLTSHGLVPFGVYRILLALVVLAYFAFRG